MKECFICKNLKLESEFSFRSKVNKTLGPWCKVCKRQYDREYWAKTSTKRRKQKRYNIKALTKIRNKFITDYLSEHPCVDCDEKDIIVLDFDHTGNKKYNISCMPRVYSLEKIKKEIAKCEVRCANCHRRKTYKERNYTSREVG